MLIDNAVYDSQSIEVKMNALGLALGDQLVLLVEVVEELAIVLACGGQK